MAGRASPRNGAGTRPLENRFNLCYNGEVRQSQKLIPESIRPLLWSLNWNKHDVDKDKTDIIMAVVNEGTLEQWQWLVDTYGKDKIRGLLQERMMSEFHPESLKLAKLVFNVNNLHASRSTYRQGASVVASVS